MIVAIVGPTASGKTALGLQLAKCVNEKLSTVFSGGVEIVSADSMALYRGMDIGTAKPTLAQRQEVKHHFIDVLWPDEEASVAVYQRKAREVLADISTRSALALVVGGSPLYLRALLEDFVFPPRSLELRAALEAECESFGSPVLHQRLRRLDPVAANNIEANNARRVIRALEVIELTGEKYSSTLPVGQEFYPDCKYVCLSHELKELDKLIDLRSQNMFDTGLLEETLDLLKDSVHPLGRTAAKATGYLQAQKVIAGTMDSMAAVQEVALLTRRVARKQIKWFKRYPKIQYYPCSSTGDKAGAIASIAEKITAELAEKMGE